MPPRSLFLLAALGLAHAQEAPPAGETPRPDRDPQVDRIVAEISPAEIEASVRQLVAFETRHTLSETDHPKRGIGAARNWIKEQFDRFSRDSGGRLEVRFDSFRQPPAPPRIPRAIEIVNVVAVLPGRLPEAKNRVFVVCAHYDSRASSVNDEESLAPGANDNASGTAAVLELARVLSHHEFDATLVFLALAAEEQGLQGARHWADQARREKRQIAGVLNNDIIGNPRREDGRVDRSVRLFAEGVPAWRNLSEDVLTQIRTGGECDFPTRQLARSIGSAAARYVPQLPVRFVFRRDRYLRGGDHTAFLDAGFPAVRFTEPEENFRHQHQDVRTEEGVQFGDLPEFVDFSYLADVTRVNAAALVTLALAPASPREVAMDTARLENDTRLTWASNSEPDLAGYRVLWRDSTAVVWEHAVDVGRATEYVARGVSKDNVVFGVQAFDTQGHASPAVYPMPRRTP